MNILVFEDAIVPQLFPITTGRPAYSITYASYRLIDWIAQLKGNLVGAVRPYLQSLQSHDSPSLSEDLDMGDAMTLVINARLVASVSNFDRITRLLQTNGQSPTASRVARDGWSVAVALIPTKTFENHSIESYASVIEDYCIKGGDPIDTVELGFDLVHYPHEVVRYNLECFEENINHRIERGLRNGKYTEKSPGVFVAANTRLDEFSVADTSAGPIVIDENSTVGPFTLLRGPIYVGPNSRISEHSSVKDCVSLGHTTKIGGEIEGSVIEAYTNKQHHGFLGHSYLGSWINLGAGTCNSDLKNTYGMVNMTYNGVKVATGMQFIGCIMGDFAKTAINTSIFTGKTIGTCSMVYGFVTTNVPSFVNYARSFGQITELPSSVMASTQQRMFTRRKVEQRECDVKLIDDMYEQTRSERQLSEEPLAL